MKRIIKVLHTPKDFFKGGSKWDLYEVIMLQKDGSENEFPMTRDDYDIQRKLENIYDALNDLWDRDKIIEMIEEYGELKYNEGEYDEVVSNAGASI